ncbi:MAG: hypothetical protein DWQ05_01310 [Calditrichaeota bacterium]|nr:MAG: hypothetical protein DWQ05_01310 [Calditrichota bacterium]
MKDQLKIFLLSLFITAFASNAIYAQSQSTDKQSNKFLLSGYGFTNFEKAQDGISSFSSGFSPIILWKSGERLFFESEFEFELEDGGTQVGLEYAQLFYTVTDNVLFGVGKFLNPNNLFMERLHPTWINKLPNIPFGVSGHGGVPLLATTQLGAQLKGAFPVQSTKIIYAVYVSNGPVLNVEEEADHTEGETPLEKKNRIQDAAPEDEGDGHDAAAPGTLNFNNFQDNNNNKAFGARIGFLPFPQLEIGIGLEIANVGTEDSHLADLQSSMQVFDLSYTRDSGILKGQLDVRGQFVWLNIDQSDEEPLNYKNESRSGYGQLAYRPVKIENSLLKNLEFVFRYDYLDLPELAELNTDLNRTTYGVNYWLAPNSAVKFAFQNKTIKEHEEETETLFITQFTLGF